MGFFGMQKAEERIESPAAAEEHFEEKPALPRASSTVIAQGVTLKGTLRGEGVVQVEGVVEGEFDLTGAVIVAETGLIRGPIKADVVRVAGRVEGSVQAREHLRLEPTGSLDGDVTTASLVVEDGGTLNGRCTTTKAPAPELEFQGARMSTALEFGPEFDLEEER